MGMTTIDDFNHTLNDLHHKDVGSDDELYYFNYHPFDRFNWVATATWTELTHWVQLPHLIHFSSAAELLLRLATEDLRPARAGMKRRQERDLVRATMFWSEALARMGLC